MTLPPCTICGRAPVRVECETPWNWNGSEMERPPRQVHAIALMCSVVEPRHTIYVQARTDAGAEALWAKAVRP